jgi:drug/metabolite transporter (DMT)-like permease
MNIPGALICCFLLTFSWIVVKALWEKNKGKPFCRLNVAIVAIGVTGSFGFEAIALLLGHTEDRGPFANLVGAFLIVVLVGIFLGSFSNCGEKRK